MDFKTVLLSGGWESVACLLKAKKKHQRVMGVFFDYGQPYLKEEIKAVSRLASIIDFNFSYIKIQDMKRDDKVFIDRNKRFIEEAKRMGANEVWLGCRAPADMFDEYMDSNWQFAQRMSKEIGVKINTPLIMWPKPLVKYYVESNGVPAEFIYSSEGFNYAT